MADRQPFEFEQVDFFRVHPPLKPQILFHSDGLGIEHGFQNIGHMKVNNGNFEFDQVVFYSGCIVP